MYSHYKTPAQYSTSITRPQLNIQRPLQDPSSIFNVHYKTAAQHSTSITRPQLNIQRPLQDPMLNIQRPCITKPQLNIQHACLNKNGVINAC